MKTKDEKATEYYNNLVRPLATEKGLVETAYVTGAMDQEIIDSPMKDFINAIALYRENPDGSRTFTAFKNGDMEKLQELYSKINF